MRESRRVLLAAQNRIRRPLRGPSELGARDAAHPSVQAGFREDRLGELGPGCITFRGKVPDAKRPLQQLTRRSRQMADVRRGGALVVDNRDLVALTRKVE